MDLHVGAARHSSTGIEPSLVNLLNMSRARRAVREGKIAILLRAWVRTATGVTVLVRIERGALNESLATVRADKLTEI